MLLEIKLNKKCKLILLIDRLRKTTVVDDRQIIKAVKLNPKIHKNHQPLESWGDALSIYTPQENLTQNYRSYSKMQTSDQHQK